MDFVLREWAVDDSIEELTALLHRAYAPLGKMGLNYTAVDQTAEVTARRIARGTCFAAVIGNQIVGTLTVEPPGAGTPSEYYARPEVAVAHQFAVESAHQGCGIGAALLNYAEHWAYEQGYSELAIDTAETASHLVDYYVRRGFKPVERIYWPGKTYHSLVLSKPLYAEPDSSTFEDFASTDVAP